jgi:hypothetical protein
MANNPYTITRISIAVMWFSDLEELGHLGDLAGQHVMIVDCEQCSASFLFAWALQRANHAVCLWEKPFHYQTVLRSLSRGSVAPENKIFWHEKMEEVIFKEGNFVVLDNLYALELLSHNVVNVLRRLRASLGKTGVLVTLVPSGEKVESLRYEADVVVRLTTIESADVTGRLSVQRRGQPPSELVFTVKSETVIFKRV